MQGNRSNQLKKGTNAQPKSGSTQEAGKAKKSQTNILAGCLGCLGMLVVIVIVAIIAIRVAGDKDKPSQQQAASQAPIAASTAAGIEGQVRSKLVNAIGETTNTEEPRIVNLQVNDHLGTAQEGDKIVVATLQGDDNLSDKMIKGGMQLNSIEVFKSLFSVPAIEEVDLLWQFPMTDDYGNETLTTVLKISLTKETADKINWKNFDRNNFETVADSYWESPAFRE